MAKRRGVGFAGDVSGNYSRNELEEGDFLPSNYLLLSNIGAQGAVIFSSQEDYDRFEAYLYLLNAIESPRASNFFLDDRNSDIFSVARGDLLVAIGAYSFTPKGFLILVRELAPKGIAKFMQKVQTAYTMYFNGKYQRHGRIFHSGYRADIAQSDAHLKYLVAMVHMHPAVLFNPHWEEAAELELRVLANRVAEYRYSSFGEYVARKFYILSPEHFPKYCSAARDAEALLSQWKKGVQFVQKGNRK